MQLGGDDDTIAIVIGTDVDMRFDRRLADRDFLVSGDALHRTVEACGVARGKDLLWIRLAARAIATADGSDNPGPDLNPNQRPGDNLYSDSLVVLDAKTVEQATIPSGYTRLPLVRTEAKPLPTAAAIRTPTTFGLAFRVPTYVEGSCGTGFEPATIWLTTRFPGLWKSDFLPDANRCRSDLAGGKRSPFPLFLAGQALTAKPERLTPYTPSCKHRE